MEVVADSGNSTTTLPVDLIIEIISLLPAKSIIRFQSVSKQWFSIIRSKDFVDKFLTRSKTRPHLLLVLELFLSVKRLLFSVPEHNDSNDKTSTAISRHDMTRSRNFILYYRSRPVNGFVCFIDDTFSSTSVSNSITVCNPITRQTVKLPDVRNNGREVYGHLGYDPVEDQYKVLCVMAYEIYGSGPVEHYVCTVSSSEKQEWRKIESTTVDNYRYAYQGICIDGAIYYGVGESNIVRFDVRSENIEMIKAPEESNTSTTCYFTLVNYNGRLGGVEHDYYQQEIRLWVLEDVVKQEWSRETFKYPCEWEGFGLQLQSTGMIHTSELVVFQTLLTASKTFYVYYYDFNKESSRKVEVQGVENELPGAMFCYPGYVENTLQENIVILRDIPRETEFLEIF